MSGLGETAARLARLRRRPAVSSEADGGAGRLSETVDFGANPGGLRMFSYVPAGLAPGAPLVVVLHGCAQRAGAFAEHTGWLTLADRNGFALLAPEQTPANSPNRCFNWFQPSDAARDCGEAASIRAMVAHAVCAQGLDVRRVFVTGLSAGGAMTAVMLATYPEVFAAGAIVAGLPYGVADNVRAALGAMQGGRARTSAELGELVRRAAPAGGPVPRLSIWHGEADATVNPRNAVEIARQWAFAHGLPEAPSETQALPGRTRAVWRAPGGTDVLIESHLIQGVGHGAPLASTGAAGLGAVAPFMLEAGVSSSLEIAGFWGLAQAPAASEPGQARGRGLAAWRTAGPAASAVAAGEGRRGRPVAAAIGVRVLAAIRQRLPAPARRAIAKALASAGLTRRGVRHHRR